MKRYLYWHTDRIRWAVQFWCRLSLLGGFAQALQQQTVWTEELEPELCGE